MPSILRTLSLLCGLLLPGLAVAEPMRVQVLGGLAGVAQYERHERPFWTETLPQLTGGAVVAEIAPHDRSGIRPQDLLRLLRLGVVGFGNVLAAIAAHDEPELNALDLPGLNPSLEALRRSVELWRPRVARLLLDRYGIELLAIYTHPAQVVFCRTPYAGLAELFGRKVRTSSVGQSELVDALGGTGVVIPFAEMAPALARGAVDCAITGTLSGNAIGLADVATHLSPLALGWGVSVFVANRAALAALPEPARQALRAGVAGLETQIWDWVAEETAQGLACNTGRPECRLGRAGRMTLVTERAEDDALRQRLLETVVLPGWVERCGAGCAAEWNRIAAPSLGLRAQGGD